MLNIYPRLLVQLPSVISGARYVYHLGILGETLNFSLLTVGQARTIILDEMLSF